MNPQQNYIRAAISSFGFKAESVSRPGISTIVSSTTGFPALRWYTLILCASDEGERLPCSSPRRFSTRVDFPEQDRPAITRVIQPLVGLPSHVSNGTATCTVASQVVEVVVVELLYMLLAAMSECDSHMTNSRA